MDNFLKYPFCLSHSVEPKSGKSNCPECSAEFEIDARLDGLIHPRKALVGDYNKDNLPDIFVVGHGYDQPPWPGEPPVLLLSSADGLRSSGGLTSLSGYYHGAASVDIDKDGDLDVFVTDTTQPFFLINDGTGNFIF